MKTAAAILFAAAVAIAVTPLVAGEYDEKKVTPAVEKDTMKAEAAEKAKQTEKISGTIAKINAEANSIEVKEGERVAHLKLDEKTQIRRGEEKLELKDLKVGDRVEVVAQDKVAHNIHIKPAETKKTN